MAGGPSEGDGRVRRAFMGTSQVPVCRRLHLVAVLLGIVGILGLVTAAMVATAPAGDGLDDLLPIDEADVSGQVRDSDGYLIEGARVSYTEGGLSDTTGTTGWYFLEGVSTGKVVLTMEAIGYKTVKKTVHLERGHYTVDFLAEPGNGVVEVPDIPTPKPGDPGGQTWLMALAIAVASVFALVGAYASYSHKWYPLVIIGCLLGVLTWGWFIGSLISLLSLIIVLPLKGQFGPKAIECELPWHEEPPPDLEMPEEDGGEATEAEALDVTSLPDGPQGGDGAGGMPPG
ncbi:MAG: carboxypeptidase regulatory-like domain-containing protein [Thermoplasmata archaeon]|nr:MAG: carboxypeptidase regulatory-like domain-containing protein [Thermoplasmata archaeon]